MRESEVIVVDRILWCPIAGAFEPGNGPRGLTLLEVDPAKSVLGFRAAPQRGLGDRGQPKSLVEFAVGRIDPGEIVRGHAGMRVALERLFVGPPGSLSILPGFLQHADHRSGAGSA